jgi:hypothetical protein
VLKKKVEKQMSKTKQTAETKEHDSAHLEELCSRSTALDVHAQAHAQEALEVLAQSFWFLQRGRAVRGNEIEGLEGLFVQVRRFIFDHLDGHDSQRPDVDLCAVFLLLDDFRCHPVRGADHRRSLRLLISEFGAEPKVGCVMDVDE